MEIIEWSQSNELKSIKSLGGAAMKLHSIVDSTLLKVAIPGTFTHLQKQLYREQRHAAGWYSDTDHR